MIGGVGAMLVVTALAAGYLPVRRVTRVDAMRALRAAATYYAACCLTGNRHARVLRG